MGILYKPIDTHEERGMITNPRTSLENVLGFFIVDESLNGM